MEAASVVLAALAKIKPRVLDVYHAALVIYKHKWHLYKL